MPETNPSTSWKPKYNPWLIAPVVALAAFMEVLDTSIANVALPHISGSLGASEEQGTWVLTTYLVANAIVLPISGWITSIVGRKRFFLICIGLFTASSVLCGIAWSLPILLVARTLQGIGGGGLQPMAQSILADVFPPEKRGLAFSVYGLTVVVAPALGPTLGGWITDSYSWHWIFLINLPVGLLASGLVFRLVEDPPFLVRRKLGESRFDYLGFSALALGVAALQIALDKGQEDDWLGSHFILTLVIVAVLCLSFLIIWEWFEKDPIVDVKIFKHFTFATSTTMMFLIGMVYFSSMVLMPQFLQNLMGYTAEDAGLVVSFGAALLLVEMPIVGVLTGKYPAKYLMAFGWLTLSAGLYFSVKLVDLDIGFGTAAFIMVMQTLPLAFLFIPSTTAAYIGVPQEKSGSVAGLINFARNIGSSVGTSLATTILARRIQVHQERLSAHTALGDHNFQSAVNHIAHSLQLQSGVGKADAHKGALAQFYQAMQGQAAVLSYMDTYCLLAAAAGAMFLLAFVLRKNNPKMTEQHAGH
ncbi:MAG TPA: DHA2 family efflux MFS transporter permease subunit [Bryobacteraceae bacterium]